MKTYRIIAKTNGYIANRDIMFKGKCEVTLSEGLTLREAQCELLDLYNKKYETGYTNWGLVVAHNDQRLRSHRGGDTFATSFRDGTRSFAYDGRTFAIEEESAEDMALAALATWGVVCTVNGDPWMIDDVEDEGETKEKIESQIESFGVTIVDDDEDRAIALAKLDLPESYAGNVYQAGEYLFAEV